MKIRHMLLLLGLLFWGQIVSAESLAIITVTSSNDIDDGTCDILHCSLREAINEANSNGNPDTIEFSFSSKQTILLNSLLPTITTNVFIDGIGTNGSACPSSPTTPAALHVVIDGRNLSPPIVSGGIEFGFGSDDGFIRGVSIINFDARGILLTNTTGISIECTEIGVNGSEVGPNRIGISLGGENIVGGIEDFKRNVISGNTLHGIQLDSNGQDNLLSNNFICVGVDGVTAVGNGGSGIQIIGTASDNEIGTTNSGNVIAYNETGVSLSSSTSPKGASNSIRGNQIYSNARLGIDIITTQNPTEGEVNSIDAGDVDDEANGGQNQPTLTVAETSGFIQGELSSEPLATYIIDFYLNDSCDESESGEGVEYKQSTVITTDISGVAQYDILGTFLPTVGQFITATATDDDGNTSEFSNCVAVAAATFIVNINSGSDAAVGDGVCDIDLTQSGSQCSLRAAIEEINNLPPSAYRVTVDANFGPVTILLSTPLPEITNRVFIDATTMDATYCPTKSAPGLFGFVIFGGIGLPNGSHLLTLGSGSEGSTIKGFDLNGAPPGGDGIRINSDNNSILCNRIRNNGDDGIHITSDNNRIGSGGDSGNRNVIYGNSGAGVQLNASANTNQIRGNYIGSDDGDTASPNAVGIHIFEQSNNNVIGGDTAIKRNIVSGNTTHGIWIEDESIENRISGNYIGLSRDGLNALPNDGAGIRIETSSLNSIGDSSVPRRNVISGNDGIGIYLIDASSTQINGNFIGTDKTGLVDIPNQQAGIRAEGGELITIGGFNQEDGNVISGNVAGGIILNDSVTADIINNKIGVAEDGSPLGNRQHGIVLENGSSFTDIIQNTISHNFLDGVRLANDVLFTVITTNNIGFNGWMGIDLGLDGISPNDGVPDSDTGANNLLNFPEIIGANIDTGEIRVRYAGAKNISDLRLDFYRSATCYEPDYTQGEVWLGNYSIDTNANGQALSTQVVGGFSGGQYLTVTATNPTPFDHTSEFSACFLVEIPSSVRLNYFEMTDNHPAITSISLAASFTVLLILTAIWAKRVGDV